MSSTGSEASIRDLIQSVGADAQRLAKAQAELASTELQQTKQEAAATGGLIGAALALGGLGVVFLLVTLAYVLVALGLPTWAGFGIVTLLLLLGAGVLGAAGRSKAKGITGPTRAVAELKRTAQVLSGKQPETLPTVRGASEVAPRTS